MAVQVIKRWGNSLAVRIPAGVADEAHFAEDQEVDVQVEEGVLVIRAHSPIRLFSMERYKRQLRERKLELHETIDWGEPRGTELSGPDDPTRNDQW